MAIKKPGKSGDAEKPQALAPRTAPGDKRTFDARPKPSDNRARRTNSTQPTYHIDKPGADPFDKPDEQD